MNYSSFICVAISLISLTSGEVLHNWATCEESDSSKCSIEEVRLTPCPEAAQSLPCKMKKGTTSTLSFDFTPKFTAEKLEQQAYSSSFVDLPMPGMQTDGCQSTTCPLKSGEKYSYNYDLYLAPSFPLSNYNVKWRVWNAEDSKDECCVIVKVKLVR